MPYQVQWARCNVFDTQGNQSTLVRGDFVPDDIDDVQKEQLSTFGATRFVDTSLPVLQEATVEMLAAPVASINDSGEPVAVEEFPATGEPVGLAEVVTPADAVVTDDKPPAKSASKPEWEDFAVSRGMLRADAEGSSKSDLIARFGG